MVITGSENVSFRAQLVVPELRQLYDYWLEKARGRQMPGRSDIHPAHIPKLLPHISLVDVDAGSGACCVRLAGTRLRDVYDREITGLAVEELDLGELAREQIELGADAPGELGKGDLHRSA